MAKYKRERTCEVCEIRVSGYSNNVCKVCRANMTYHMRQGLGHCEWRVGALAIYSLRMQLVMEQTRHVSKKRRVA